MYFGENFDGKIRIYRERLRPLVIITKITHECTWLKSHRLRWYLASFPGNSYTFVREQHCKNSL